MADVARALDGVLAEPRPCDGLLGLNIGMRRAGQLRQVPKEGVDVRVLEVIARRHALSSLSYARDKIGARLGSGRFRVAATVRHTLQLFPHHFERRALHRAEDGFDLRRRSSPFFAMTRLAVQAIQIVSRHDHRAADAERFRGRPAALLVARPVVAGALSQPRAGDLEPEGLQPAHACHGGDTRVLADVRPGRLLRRH